MFIILPNIFSTPLKFLKILRLNRSIESLMEDSSLLLSFPVFNEKKSNKITKIVILFGFNNM